MDKIQNWDDAVAWWRSAPDDQKLTVVVVFALCGLIAALIANGKGRNPIVWFVVGVVLPIVGIVIAAAMSNLRHRAAAVAPTVVVQQPI